ncbi:LacI family DNA-binding transcriptional regulator [Asticcacaulis sp. EMRT-3]|uniref:LacI family DNA-binding transcriptional regulator n=1 Tax=Asticcacaulis sp. EMRT-3 TaxID=3040349 RepID=UPI0024AFAB6C|nr:LacI family DNA-binding transcriptional regulator [Asticcacaulis sp. EMRT-3]MDI7775392.1 LacI family DNA-binding transcriptional regulator [Asticcacaulis sp. EMRT-3]
MSAGKPTIDDVAALSGVARATVSRVLNGGPNVREEVRVRVLQAVDKLQYKVNMQARYLAGGRTQMLAMVYASDLDSQPNSFYHAGLELGALRACSERGFQLLMHTINQHSLNKSQKILDVFDSRRCDGLILTPPFSDDLSLLHELQKRKAPVVCIAPGYEAQAAAAGVGIDDEVAGYEITRYMLSLGHRNMGFIKGLEGHLSAEERYTGFRRALKEAGLDDNSVPTARGNFSFRSGVETTARLLALPNRPTALICANDDMAVGALFTAHKLGLEVPKHLSVSGFDDTPVSEIIWPPLTTVHQPLKEIGARAVALVLDQINGARSSTPPGAHRLEVVAHRVVMRESAADLTQP